VAAAREVWEELALRCPGLNAVGTIEVGNVLHHVFTTDLAEGCNVALGAGIVACRWVGWEALSPAMLKPTAAALLSCHLAAVEIAQGRVSEAVR
jgi:8-oxo-dGTP diphosphatase